MPNLSQEIIDDLTNRLGSYLAQRGVYGTPQYLTSGGSAAIFRAHGPDGIRAFKAFDPRFFEEDSGEAERRRLEVQRRLIGHTCPYLVQTFRVDEFGGTAIMEMEFVDWPNLKDSLAEVPDNQVASLLVQLVKTAKFLEGQGIVHRDIKPENIHIAHDFSALKLLDLGVARDIEAPDGVDACITDHGNKRPFLATAQYSSPEYLFRLDEPNARLWKGLTFYQIGAVLHDLIMKVPLFNQEVSLDNKWLVSKAVLVKNPSFIDGNPTRLARLKALAARCLVKNLDTRLLLVNWQDFESLEDQGPQGRLRSRLERRSVGAGNSDKLIAEQRLSQERDAHWAQMVAGLREGLIGICRTQMPMTFSAIDPGAVAYGKRVTFSVTSTLNICCRLEASWGNGYNLRDAEIKLSAFLIESESEEDPEADDLFVVCTSTIDSGVAEAMRSLLDAIANAIERGLNHIEAGLNTAGARVQLLSFRELE